MPRVLPSLKWFSGLLLLPLISGCGGGHDLMPLQVGNHWTYEVSMTFKSYLCEVKVVRQSSVAGEPGFVLSGPMGETQMAWKGDVLVADRFNNTYIKPAVPLLVDTTDRVRRSLPVVAQGIWGKLEGEAVLNQGPGEEIVGGRKIKVVKSELTISSKDGRTIKLRTHFQPGAGIATQLQWVNGELLVRLERVSGS